MKSGLTPAPRDGAKLNKKQIRACIAPGKLAGISCETVRFSASPGWSRRLVAEAGPAFYII